jgi:hypothetical protein
MGGIHWLELLLFPSIQMKDSPTVFFPFSSRKTQRSGFKTLSKAQWRCYKLPQNAQPPEADHPFSVVAALAFNLAQGF